MKQKNLILMGVAVGCGLVAAFLTSQMSGKTQTEQVEMIVAARDLPVGTMISQEDLAKAVVRIKVNKDAVPTGAIESEQELVGNRLGRNFAKDEPFKKSDLSKGGLLKPPEGLHTVSLPMSAPQAVAGFVGPGSHVDVLATVRLSDNRIRALPLLMDMLVLAVDANTQFPKEGAVFQTVNSITLAVNRKQALLLELAKTRGCQMTLLLRSDDKAPLDEKYDIDKVIELLQDDKNPAEVVGAGRETVRPKQDTVPTENPGVVTPPAGTPATVTPPAGTPLVVTPPAGTPSTVTPPTPGVTSTPGVTTPTPKPGIVMVKVLVTPVELPADTQLTPELIATFRTIEVPQAIAEGAFADLTPYQNKYLVRGLSKNQWVTEANLTASPGGKPRPSQDEFSPKPGPSDPPAPTPVPTPANKRRTHDMKLYTPQGLKIYRYEEVRPGEWRLWGVVTPNDYRAEDDAPPRSDRKVD